MPRASIRLATFAQAISNTRATSAMNTPAMRGTDSAIEITGRECVSNSTDKAQALVGKRVFLLELDSPAR